MSDKSNLPTVLSRITEYLDSGGLWNPELADHAAVRDLICDARDEIDRLTRILAALRDTPCVATRCSAAIAVAAAEQEVGNV